MIPVLFVPVAIIAEAIGTFTGFGATTILLPIATLMMPVRDAIVLVGLFHFFGTFGRTISFIKKINIKVAMLFGIPSLVFSYIGASLLTSVDTILLTRLVGIALIAFAFYSLVKDKIALPKSNITLVGGGTLVGFVAGLIGTAGAMRGAFLTSWNLAPQVYLGTGALMGLGADATRVLAYWNEGLLDFVDIKILGLLIVIAIVGTLIGRYFVLKTKNKVFGKVVFVALLLSGLRLLLI